MDTPRKNVEQVALTHLLDNAYESFQKRLLSVGGLIVLWSSFDDDKHLVTQFLAAGGESLLRQNEKLHLLDRRRKRTVEDQDFIEVIEEAASEALDYKRWAVLRDGQPIWQDALVSYCSAFENFLKTIAVAFRLATASGSRGLEREIFVPGPELTAARKAVRAAWDDSHSRLIPRAQRFFETEVAGKNPDAARYRLPDIAPEAWHICGAAFTLRNAIVHSMGRPEEQIQLGESVFDPAWEIELKAKDLRLVKLTFADICCPFSVLSQIL